MAGLQSSSMMEYLSLGLGFWYTSTYLMLDEFVRILLSDPKTLMSSKVIAELALFYSNSSSQVHAFLSMCLSAIPDEAISAWCNAKLDILSGWCWTATTLPGKILAKAWFSTWSTVAIAITPDVPVVLKPVVDGVVAPAAKALAFSLIMWIIKLLFGIG